MAERLIDVIAHDYQGLVEFDHEAPSFQLHFNEAGGTNLEQYLLDELVLEQFSQPFIDFGMSVSPLNLGDVADALQLEVWNSQGSSGFLRFPQSPTGAVEEIDLIDPSKGGPC